MMEKENYKIALFIDAENECNHVGEVLEILSKRGRVLYRQVYGKIDGKGKLTIEKWQTFEKYGCTIFGHSSTKANATDIRLIAGAVNLINEKELDAICIMAGDGDYLPLINIAREKEIFVIIASEKGKLSEKTKYNCDKLIVLGDGKENKQEKTDENDEQEDKILEIAKKILKNSGKDEMDLGSLCKALYNDNDYKKLKGEEKFKQGKAGDFFRSQKAQKVFSVQKNQGNTTFISLK